MHNNLITTSKNPAYPIWLVQKSEFESWFADRPENFITWAKSQNFTADKGQILILPTSSGGIEGVIVGTGSQRPSEVDPWLFAGVAEKLPVADYHIDHDLGTDAAYHAALGWALSGYKFTRYTKDNRSGYARLVLPQACDPAKIERVVRGTFTVRDLVNTPTNDLGPGELEGAARKIAVEHGAEFSCIVGEDLLAANLPAIHAVGRASAEAPRLIDIRWGPDNAPKLTLVGKGVCFDSGGLDLKPSSGMRLMKKDMGGAAHALALAEMIMSANLNVRLRVLVPAVENAISGNAFRPGDVIQTHKGLTVEIGNTDAEGRLILCDALSLGDLEKPDLMLDFATLTGAARVALGPDIPPFFTDDHTLANDLARLSVAEADPVWRLPLWTPYADGLKSKIADTNNIADGGFGGAITAALYLKKFVSAAGSWAHFDVYAWNASTRAGRPTGGEAMALRTVYALLEERFPSVG